ncbi:zinc-finger homeodomain protein 9-like [Salvia miltiorrhiza]|uniref:zinc-finger homeodomain protein 9-like n=1 Tax=Salvia miltiorrhiza TaxID=226208 RepID=UPI0025AD34D6|nr:zinc-finger homeodomain protein 9-like [Salvia miltiorrhiza]
MDLGNSSVKTPEAESETPTRIQPTTKSASAFTNGVLKRHAPLQHFHHHPVVVTYKECLKNHAATLGGHAVDGCGEFMPSPASNPAEPTSLKCAACGCHRNFHRRDPEDPLPVPPAATPALEYQPHHRHHPPPPRAGGGNSPNNSPSPPPISSSYYPSAPHMLLALSHGLSAPPPDSNHHSPISAAINPGSTPMLSSSSRKRYRTKFTQFQKEKMLEFAEKVEWKMQKRDEDAINSFCGEIGVDKGVFKVWMHNNKNTFGKKDHPPPPHLSNSNTTTEISTPPPANGNGNGLSYCNIKEDVHAAEELGHQLHLHDNRSSHAHAHALGTNGSSSS